VPAADTLNDVIQTFVRLTAGAILFAASTNAINLPPVISGCITPASAEKRLEPGAEIKR
jgi:hypothetical protein